MEDDRLEPEVVAFIVLEDLFQLVVQVFGEYLQLECLLLELFLEFREVDVSANSVDRASGSLFLAHGLKFLEKRGKIHFLGTERLEAVGCIEEFPHLCLVSLELLFPEQYFLFF